MSAFLLIVNIAVLLGLIFLLFYMQKKHVSFSKRVFAALGLGIVLGFALQFIYGRKTRFFLNQSAGTASWGAVMSSCFK